MFLSYRAKGTPKNWVVTIQMQFRLNHMTKSRRRSPCSHRDGDFPEGDLLRLVARLLESIFDTMLAPFTSFDELVILLCWGAKWSAISTLNSFRLPSELGRWRSD